MRFPKLERRPELDALRGFFILLMVTVHLPTQMSSWLNQPLGYISAAVGFVGLSAVLVGRIYFEKFIQGGAAARSKIWRRSLKIYAYHLAMLALAFTVVATYAVETRRPAILNLLHFYLGHPIVAVTASLLLLYCPPLLDILPMYVVFLFLTPIVLAAAARVGWRWVLAGSAAVYVGAQFGLRAVFYSWLCAAAHLQVPLRQTGAFNMLAWQAVWVVGLWLGARSAMGEMPLNEVPRWGVAAAAAVCAFFLAVRHDWLGSSLSASTIASEVDKWKMAPLRVINIAGFVVLGWWMRRYVVGLVAHEPLLTLGKVSLEVFCAHLFFVFTGLALLSGDSIHLHGLDAMVLIAITYPTLTAFAYWLEMRKRRKARLANSNH